MVRVVQSRNEFEGVVTVSLALAGEDLAPWPADHSFTTVGLPHPHIDGAVRVTGRARYTADLTYPGMLHALVLRSPHARARVLAVDASAALALPGVRDVLHRFNAPPTPIRGDPGVFRDEVRFAGDEVAAVAADSEEIAREALRRIVVRYEPLPHVVDVEDAMAPGAPALLPEGNVKAGTKHDRGDVDAAFATADLVVDGEYRTATQMHNSMEPHGALAAWDGDSLTLHESTQHIFGVRAGMCEALGLPLSKVRVLCDFMGGGFGSKGRVGKYSVLAALFALRTGRPVRCLLSRADENLAAGNRPQSFHRLRLSLTGGRISAIQHDAWSNAGQADSVPAATGPTNVLYDVPNIRSRAHGVQTNVGSWSAFRAPGYTEGTFALESAVDELALAAGIDPLDLRMRHARTERDPATGVPFSSKALAECYEIGAREIGWERWRREGLAGSTPTRRRGLGMASQTWGGAGRPPAYVLAHVNSDGTAVVRCGTQDLGTGTKTVLAQVVAEELGISFDRIRVEIGDTSMPYTPISAGSLTTASVAPAARAAGADAAAQLREVLAGVLELPVAEIRIASDMVVTASGARHPLGAVLGRIPNYTVIGRGERQPNPAGFIIRTFGAHFVDLEVDVATGEIFILRIVAVHDVGRIVNPLAARSQVEGGILQGLGFALTEERVVDRLTGRVTNPSLEGYKVPTVYDVPAITVRFIGRPDLVANNMGVKGLGEPPIIPVAPAIANAVANAIGVRVRRTPITPQRVLDALAGAAR